MTAREALENKAACIQAVLRGEKVEFLVHSNPEEWAPINAAASFDHDGQFYRIAPKPEPKIPSGVFWVRSKDRPGRERLVVAVEGDMMHYAAPRGSFDANNRLAIATAAKNWEWSHDRITWNSFTPSA